VTRAGQPEAAQGIEQAPRATRLPALPVAMTSFVLAFAAAALGLAFVYRGLAVLWPAAGAVAGIWLITPRRLRMPVLAGLALGLFASNLVGHRPLNVNLLFVAANLGEAWLLGRLLERWTGLPIRLDTLPQVAWFIGATAVTVTVGGALGAAAIALIPDLGFDHFVQNWLYWVRSRGIGMLTVAPAIIALGTMTRTTLAHAWNQARWSALTLGAALLVTFVMASHEFRGDEMLALLVLLAIVYPLVLVVAARSEPVWVYVCLLLITLIVVWRLAHGSGIFRDNVIAAQGFLLVSSLWALTLAVVMHQQRLARISAEGSERRMRQAIAAGRGFTFDYDPRRDFVRRADPDQILAPFSAETGASFFARLLPEDRPRLQELVTSLSPATPVYETTYGSRRPDGKVVWLQERGVGEFDEDGQLVRLQGLTMDVTARREAEEALREADRRKDRFIATLAHELRNPLAPIRTAAELLGSARAGPGEIDWARRVIQRQVGHMATLLDDLLDVARITRGKLEIRKQLVRLDSVIETAVEVARPLLDARQQRLRIELPQPVPLLSADPLRLAQVISNLLTNAAKYSEAGAEVVLSATVRGAALELKVRDEGIGIPAEALPAIFQVFAQVEGTSARSEGGLGIGLSLVKGLVELHGGTITAHSDGPGQGSEFTVTLPCVPADAGQPGAAQDDRQPVTGKRLRILVVDDNRDAADSLALLLGLDGHEVRTAYAGRSALDEAAAFLPDACVLDVGLPDLSGYELATLLRRLPALDTVHLIAVTGWGQDEDRQRALAAGFDHHLTKPVDPERLNDLLRKVGTP
jgi:signal transduction histidine kinase